MIGQNKCLVLSGGILLVLVLLGMSLLGCSSPASELPKAVSIGTHPKGSSLNALGSGIAKVISANTKISAVDRPYSGYTEWLPLLNNGQVDLGIVGNMDVYYAYKGLAPFKEPSKNLRLISSGNGIVIGYVVRADSDIKRIADFKGKKVAVIPTAASQGLIQRTIIKAAGLQLGKDVAEIPVPDVSQSMVVFMDGRADASWASAGMGQVIEAIQKLGGVRWLSVIEADNDPAAKMIKSEFPGLAIEYVQAGSDPTLTNSAWLPVIPINLVTYKDFSEEAAYQIAKAVWQNEKELVPIHPLFKGWTKSMVREDAGVAYHVGAIRFYKEVGAWSNKMDEIQKKLLNQ